MFFTNDFLDGLLRDDVPWGDLTSDALGIGGQAGSMEFRSRFACILGGVAEAEAVLKQIGLTPVIFAASGTAVDAGALVLSVEGLASELHHGWKVAQNLIEYASGIATRTRMLVTRGREVNPRLVVACTRKYFPGGKILSMNAVNSGGGVAHRLGLSETFLLFDNHARFFASESSLSEALQHVVAKLPEKKLAVEASSLDFARVAAAAGADIIQFDKVAALQLADWIPLLRHDFPALTIAAAGGISLESMADFARTGIDVAVTSAPYFGPPQDIEVRIAPTKSMF